MGGHHIENLMQSISHSETTYLYLVPSFHIKESNAISEEKSIRFPSLYLMFSLMKMDESLFFRILRKKNALKIVPLFQPHFE